MDSLQHDTRDSIAETTPLGYVTRKFERVYTVTDYYDGPRRGVADFNGAPHIYRSLYLDSTTWDPNENWFELSPISQRTLQLALESWAIWERWDLARRRDEIAAIDSTDPDWGAMPDERERRDALAPLLESLLAIDIANRVIAKGEFRVRESSHDVQPGVLKPLEVCWTS